MNHAISRRSKTSPAQQRATDAEVRRLVAVAVFSTKRKAEQQLAEVAEVVEEVQAELLRTKLENADLKARVDIAIKPRT